MTKRFKVGDEVVRVSGTQTYLKIGKHYRVIRAHTGVYPSDDWIRVAALGDAPPVGADRKFDPNLFALVEHEPL